MVLKKVCVTGASGMVGRHILPVLSGKKISVIAASRTRPQNLLKEDEWKPWDLNDAKSPEMLEQMFDGVQAVFHFGALVPKSGVQADDKTIFNINVRPCLDLAQWALKKDIPVVFVSSSTVYADVERRGIKESDPKTCGEFGGFYGISKLLAEKVLSFYKTAGLRLIILRPSSIYGYGLDESKMISGFLKKAADNSSLRLIPPTEDRINLIHAGDVAAASLKALEHNAYGTYNIGGQLLSVFEIAQICSQISGDGTVLEEKTWEPREPICRFDLNCSRAIRAFGFKPEVDFFKGVQSMWEGI